MVYLGIHQKANACVLCLGALKDCFLVPKLDKVVASSDIYSNKFSMCLSLPICLSLRQHSLLVHLATRLSASCMAVMEPEDIVPIKQVWNYIYPDLVAREVSLENQTGDVAEFFTDLKSEWPDDSKELS